MSLLPSPPLLDETLRVVARRYRLPAMDADFSRLQRTNPESALAILIEQARVEMVHGESRDGALKREFVETLAQIVRKALRTESGDPLFQAMVLRHQTAQVREYASLSAQADQDRRFVHASVNAIAHPAKTERILPGPHREALTELYERARSASWLAVHDAVQRLFADADVARQPSFQRALMQLVASPALERLQRLEALKSDDLVRQYESLLDRDGLRPGSSKAVAQGIASQQRGCAAEASATQALEALARRLNQAEGEASFRVVTSMHVPASIPASRERAKTEWDAVLLRHAKTVDHTAVWDICLLVEAKASVDAATTDFARLLRGLRLLARAEENLVYSFQTRQGIVRVHGASLRTLPTDEASLTSTILYCCDGPKEVAPRLLSAASRMQLLSAQGSLEFAGVLTATQHADPRCLEPVWHQLLESPRYRSVLNQYPMLRLVRELMVHSEDLLAAVNGTA